MRLVTYAEGAVFGDSAQALVKTAQTFGHKQEVYSLSNVTKLFPSAAVEELRNSGSVAAARNLHFAWKPVLLQAVARESEPDEIIVYCDSSRYFRGGWSEDPVGFLKLFADSENSLGFFIGPHYHEFSMSSFSSSRFSSANRCSKLLGINISRTDWKRMPQAMAANVIFRNNDESRAILRDWVQLATETNFFSKNLRSDQAALNLLYMKHRIGSLCLNPKNGAPPFNPLEPHPPWAKNQNFMLSQMLESGGGESIKNLRSCLGKPVQASFRKMSVITYLRFQILRLTYWKNSQALVSDLYDVLAKRYFLAEFLSRTLTKVKKYKRLRRSH